MCVCVCARCCAALCPKRVWRLSWCRVSCDDVRSLVSFLAERPSERLSRQQFCFLAISVSVPPAKRLVASAHDDSPVSSDCTLGFRSSSLTRWCSVQLCETSFPSYVLFVCCIIQTAFGNQTDGEVFCCFLKLETAFCLKHSGKFTNLGSTVWYFYCILI